jgi:hypothetical protein
MKNLKRNILLAICFLANISIVFGSTEIRTCAELQNINQNLSAQYVLSNDIDCSGTQFIPIGTTDSPFTGKLDGAGYKVSYLNIMSKQGTSYVGLFGVTNNAIISQLTLENVNIKGENYVAALIGMARSTKIYNVSSSGSIQGEYIGTLQGRNIGGLIGGLLDHSILNHCHSSANISVGISPYFYVGGLIGFSQNSVIYGSYATGNVNATSSVGGLIGLLEDSSVSYSYATGAVNIEGKYAYSLSNAGGLIGLVKSNEVASSVSTSYATGNVNAESKIKIEGVGGLIGRVTASNASPMCNSGKIAKISNSFSSGTSFGYAAKGGLVGISDFLLNITNSYSHGGNGGLVGYAPCTPDVKNSYWDKDISRQNSSPNGGEGKTTAQMYQTATYANWDFNTIWNIDEGRGYPHFISSLHINTCADLQDIARNVNAGYILENDIDCSGFNFFSLNNFSGELHGNGHTISNLTASYGLFSSTVDALIDHLHIENVNITAQYNTITGAGALAGRSSGTMILDVTASGKITAKTSLFQAIPSAIGGLVG